MSQLPSLAVFPNLKLVLLRFGSHNRNAATAKVKTNVILDSIVIMVILPFRSSVRPTLGYVGITQPRFQSVTTITKLQLAFSNSGRP